jgi:HEPN domain-containing protein
MTKFKQQKFKPETAFKLIKVASDDLYASEILASAPNCRPETVLYHVQQSIEKSVKAILIYREQVVFLTHDIDVLLSLLPTEITSNLPPGAGELTQYATIRRYLDGDELIEKEDILQAIGVAKIFINWAQGLMSTTK